MHRQCPQRPALSYVATLKTEFADFGNHESSNFDDADVPLVIGGDKAGGGSKIRDSDDDHVPEKVDNRVEVEEVVEEKEVTQNPNSDRLTMVTMRMVTRKMWI